jgi:hypothetical protein
MPTLIGESSPSPDSKPHGNFSFISCCYFSFYFEIV